ncbi:MAG: hypothetical protein HQL60_05720 [Magnetococcales bacterium]|nr:hypothetical protein [Magnetococcales bacterium]
MLVRSQVSRRRTALVVTEEGRDFNRLVTADVTTPAWGYPDYDALVSSTRQHPCCDQPVSESLALSLFHIFRLTLDETTLAWQHSPGSQAQEPKILAEERRRLRGDFERLHRRTAPLEARLAAC